MTPRRTLKFIDRYPTPNELTQRIADSLGELSPAVEDLLPDQGAGDPVE